MTNCCVTDCPLPSFAKDKITRLPYCSRHQYLRTDIDRRSSYQKHMDKAKTGNIKAGVASKIRSIINTDENKFVQNQAAEDYAKLQQFFDKIAKIIEFNPYCMNCGAFIPQKFYRAASAHVLPKRKEYGFPSVATHPDNYLILGSGCGCHHKYDQSWEDAATMKIFPLAIEKFLLIYPSIAPEEKKNIPGVFLQELQPRQ